MIPKSLREKKRYILCRLIKFDMKKEQQDLNAANKIKQEMHCTEKIEENINKEIRIVFQKNVFSLYGDVGAAKMQAKMLSLEASAL